MLNRLDLRGKGESVHLPRPNVAGEEPVEQVRAILGEVRRRGDAALREFTSKFDGVTLTEFAVAPSELAAAFERIPIGLRDALSEAKDSITAFHRHRPVQEEVYEREGISVQHLELPVERAGVYVPGGRAKYPSSVLMTAIPARVAGVTSIACCVPPRPDGSLPDEVLAAAFLAGVDEVYRVGGAQAIAAMAFGTESIEKVDVIAGPGNRWVSIAQREVRGTVGVPSAFAGPSEVVVIADDTADPRWAAIDVIVQAEHGPDGFAWLITWSEQVADAVTAAIVELVSRSPRRGDTEKSLQSGGYVVLVDDEEHALAISNAIAPEHLEIITKNPEELLALVRHAGAIFLGPYAPASVGDYLAGPSHVLPTFGTARFASVLGVEDFCRRVHAVSVTASGMARVAHLVAEIASAEGLEAHAESARLRIDEPTWSAS